jgi:hypothetical protein
MVVEKEEHLLVELVQLRGKTCLRNENKKEEKVK